MAETDFDENKYTIQKPKQITSSIQFVICERVIQPMDLTVCIVRNMVIRVRVMNRYISLNHIVRCHVNVNFSKTKKKTSEFKNGINCYNTPYGFCVGARACACIVCGCDFTSISPFVGIDHF